MRNLYEIFYEHTELRRAGVIAESEEQALLLFANGDVEDDDGKDSLSKAFKSVEVVEEDI